MTPAQLEAFVRARMAAEPHHGTEGLLLFGTIGTEAYLLPNGTVRWYEEVSYTNPPQALVGRLASPQEAAGAINAATKRHPELRELLPARTAEAGCARCRGTGTFTREDGLQFDGIWCEACAGLGYLVEGTT